MTDGAALRARTFTADYPAWIALSHFLSADLVRELVMAFVAEASRGELRLDDLCDEQMSGGPAELSTWVVRIIASRDGFAGYLQNVVRALAWQSDTDMRSTEDRFAPEDVPTYRALELALNLAYQDFGSIEGWIARAASAPASLRAIGEAVSRAGAAASVDQGGPVAAAEAGLADLDVALQALAMKHLGDLAFDADRPDDALAFYDRALLLNDAIGDAHWLPLTHQLRDMIAQSRAAMLGLIEGPQSAAIALADLFHERVVPPFSLFGLNAGLDAMNNRNKSDDIIGFSPDVRACMLITPQLQNAQDLSSALEYWLSNKFDDAQRRFWAVLRRLTALGGGTLSYQAMAYYGRSMLDQLGRETSRHRQPETFEMALRLVVASGRTDAIGPEVSQSDLVEAYVTREAILALSEIATRHKGARADRLNVLLTLFAAWLSALPADQEDVAALLVGKVAEISREPSHYSPTTDRNLTVSALKALKGVAEKRPEFVALASTEIADAILAAVQTNQFRIVWPALEAAERCTDTLNPADLVRCIEAALDILDKIEPSSGQWPIAQPAISIISGRDAQALWPDNPSLASRSAQALLRHGLGSEGENVRLLALLNDILPYLDPASATDPRIPEVVHAVREGAQKITHSDVTNKIAVLFTAPALVGRAGIDDAVKGLVAVLATASANQPSLAIAHAYDPVNAFSFYLDDITREFDLDAAARELFVSPVVDAVIKFWYAAANDPLLFAPFAIPSPTAPQPIIVQNWAFVTLGFARKVGALDRIRAAMTSAAQVPMLARPIALAQAIRPSAGDPVEFDVDKIAREGRDEFYAALGNRLTQLNDLDDNDRVGVVGALVEQCLKRGPNGMDAAIFLVARQQAQVPAPAETLVKSYRNRLDRDRALARGLWPLLQAIASPAT